MIECESIMADLHDLQTVRMEVASSRPDLLPTLSIAKTSELFQLVKSPLKMKMRDP